VIVRKKRKTPCAVWWRALQRRIAWPDSAVATVMVRHSATAIDWKTQRSPVILTLLSSPRHAIVNCICSYVAMLCAVLAVVLR
jgi:hypothetical protein